MTADMIILYVTDPAKSAGFYSEILGVAPVDLSPGFAMFVLPSGLKLGLWIKQGVKPEATFTGSGAELVVHVASAGDVARTHADWQARGVAIIDPPTSREFGTSFVVTDPDGHRVRLLHAEG